MQIGYFSDNFLLLKVLLNKKLFISKYFSIFKIEMSVVPVLHNCNVGNGDLKALSSACKANSIDDFSNLTLQILQILMTVQSHTIFCKLCRAGKASFLLCHLVLRRRLSGGVNYSHMPISPLHRPLLTY